MSPGSLEAQGLISASEYQKVAALTQSASPDAHRKIAGKPAWSRGGLQLNKLFDIKRNKYYNIYLQL